MFRLATPIATAQPISEFDDISTIITHSSLTSSTKTAPWQHFVQDNGHLFYVEMTKPVHNPPSSNTTPTATIIHGRTDARSACSLCSTRSGHSCASVDTGYSSDADVQSTPSKYRRTEKSLLDSSLDSLSLQSRATDFDEDDDDGVCVDLFFDVDNKKTKHLSDVEDKQMTKLKYTWGVNDKQTKTKQPWDVDNKLASNTRQTLGFNDKQTKIKQWNTDIKLTRHPWDVDEDLCEMTRRCQIKNAPSEECHSNLKTPNLCKRHFSYRTNASEPRHQTSDSFLPCKCGVEGKTISSNPPQLIKDVVLRINTYLTSLDVGCGASWLESVLGIVPGRTRDGQTCQSVWKDGGESDRVMIKSLLPGGPAAKGKDLMIGDQVISINGRQVTWHTLDQLSSSLRHSRKVRLSVAQAHSPSPTATPVPLIPTSPHLLHDTNSILKLLIHDAHPDLQPSPFYTPYPNHADSFEDVCVLYTSLEERGEGEGGKDVLFEFPEGWWGTDGGGGVAESSVGHRLRGCLFTLHHLLEQGADDSSIRMVSVRADNTELHVACKKEGNDMLIVTAPANRFHASQVMRTIKSIIRLLRLLYGSPEEAFCNEDNHVSIHHFLACLFSCAQPLSTLKGSHLRPPRLLLDCIDYLPLPDDVLVSISSALTEYESADFVHLVDPLKENRRPFTILGSMVVYKGHATCCHLSMEDAKDVWTYLHHSGLQQLSTLTTAAATTTTTAGQSLQQVLVWREVFPTRLCHDVSGTNSVFGYSEPHARWFLMVVGLKNTLLACLLEAGGCSAQYEGACSPDPVYVDQARAVLVQLQSAYITTACDIRLNGEGFPATTTADKRCLAQIQGPPTAPFSLQGSESNPRNPSHNNHHLAPIKNSTVHPSSLSPRNHCDLAMTEEFLQTESGGRVMKGKMISMKEVAEWRRHAERCGQKYGTNSPRISHTLEDDSCTHMATRDISTYKLNIGKDNTLFAFCQVNQQEGVVITSPLSEDVQQRADLSFALHSHVTNNFRRCVSQIHASFTEMSCYQGYPRSQHLDSMMSEGGISGHREEGVMFSCPLEHLPDGKKSPPPLVYWVVGRKLRYPHCREIYVCFQESTPQNVIELAFRLSLGSMSSV